MLLDHLVVTTPALDSGVDLVETALGVSMDGGGDHVAMGTHNRLLSLGPSDYLEVIAVNPRASSPGRPRFFDLDTPRPAPRLTNWVLRVERLCEALKRAPDGTGDSTALTRGPFSWSMAVPANGRLPFDGMFPSLIQWNSSHPAPMLPDAEARLTGLTLRHPAAPALRDALDRLGFDDPRVRVQGGPIGMSATIQTPTGEKTLL